MHSGIDHVSPVLGHPLNKHFMMTQEAFSRRACTSLCHTDHEINEIRMGRGFKCPRPGLEAPSTPWPQSHLLRVEPRFPTVSHPMEMAVTLFAFLSHAEGRRVS